MPPEEHKAPEVWDWLMEIAVAVTVFLIVLGLLGFYILLGYDWYRAILEWLYGLWESVRTVMMAITILISIGLAGFIVVIFRRFIALSPTLPVMVRGGAKGITAVKTVPVAKEVSDEWQEVRKLLDSHNSSDWSMAVIRADALLDDALQYLGHEGETVKERLDKADPTMVPSLERLYSAHRIRNTIAHDPTIQFGKETLVNALRSYEQGLKELGVLREEQK